MRKVVSEFSIGGYKVLTLDDSVPNRGYREYVIDGKSFGIVPLYDIPNSIAIEANGSFVGKTVEFK